MIEASCRETRNRLQEAFDRGAEPDAASAGHLASCAECRAFREFLGAYARCLERALDERNASLAGPDGQKIAALRKARNVRRRIAYSLSGLAAAAALGGLLVATLIERQQTADYVREENSRFVDDLLNEPVFEGIEYLTASE